MDQIIQIFEIIKTFAQNFFVGWNIPATLVLGVATYFGTKYGFKAIRKFTRTRYISKNKRKLSAIEQKIREYDLTKNPENLIKNLKQREILRIKAAKRGLIRKTPSVGLKSEASLNHISYAQKTLSKADRKFIIRDAKLNLYRLDGQMQKAITKSEKWGFDFKKSQYEMSKNNEYNYTESINLNGQNISLSSNSIFAKTPTVVKNYERDVNIADSKQLFPLRVKNDKKLNNLSISPLVLEITDENNNEIFRLSDLSPRRFYEYSTEGLAYVNHLLTQNLDNEQKSAKAYRIIFYDTGNQKNVKSFDTVIKSTADLHYFAGKFDWNFGQVKPLVNYGSSKNYSEKIEAKTAFYEYEKKIVNKEEPNSFIYSSDLSKNLKSSALEKGFKSIIEENTYTNADPEPQITTLTIDGKEVFRTRVESKDLFNMTDSVVDAYILALMIKRLNNGIESKIVKSTEGYDRVYVDRNGKKIANKEYVIKQEEISSIKTLYERNQDKKNFFPAFLAVAIEFELDASLYLLIQNGIILEEHEKKLYNQYLKGFQEQSKSKALNLFGILDGNERKETSYENIRDNISGFEKAEHYQEAITRKKPIQKINTTLNKLEKDFNTSVKTSTIELDDIPHTVDVVCEDEKKAKINFKLGLIVYDAKKFKEYAYKILLESLYLIEKNKIIDKTADKNEVDKTKIEVVISFPDEQKKSPVEKSFNSVYELRDEVEKMKKDYGFMDMSDFKKEFNL